MNPARPHVAPSRYRHAYLLASLLLVITIRPFLAERVLGVGLIEAFLFITVVAGAYATAAGRRKGLILGALAALSVLARVAWLLHGTESLLYGFLGCYIAFYSVVAFSLIRSLFQAQDRITADTLCGAFSVYLILGLLWTMAYAILESAAPGSFHFSMDGAPPEARFDHFLGFSFTTLTTLGYGNVAPATPQADAMTTLEAIVGQVYLVIVIARLVALQIAQGNKSPEAHD